MRQVHGVAVPAGLSQAEPVPVSSVPASIPNAGDPRLSNEAFRPSSYEGKPRYLGKKYKAVLGQFHEPIFARLKAMSDLELWEVVQASNAVSQINCGWQDYAVAKLVRDSAAWELRTRLTAQAIEAGTGETEGLDAKRESAVAKPCAQTSSGDN